MRLLLGTLLLAGAAFGGIDWRQTAVELRVHPAQIQTEAFFHFTNTAEQPIRFTDITVNCGCMASRPVQPSYAPGEEGSLVIRVDLRNREGKLDKIVQVKMSDGEEIRLNVLVDIPKAYHISSPLVRWNREDAEQPKTIHLRNPNTIPVRLLSITSSHEALPAELITIREGFEYDVVVTPDPSAKNARAVIRMVTEPPPGEQESKTIKLYAVLP